MKDSITLFQVHPLVAPEALTVDSMKKLGATPVLVQGMQLFVDSSSIKLTEYYRSIADTVDTIFKVDTVYWAKPVYDGEDLDVTDEAALDLTKYYQKNETVDTLLLVIKGGECGVTYRKDIIFPLEEWKYGTKTVYRCPDDIPAKNPDTLSYATTVPEPLYYDRSRYVDTIVTYAALTLPEPYTKSELLALPFVSDKDTINYAFALSKLYDLFQQDDDNTLMNVTDIKWEAQDAQGAWKPMPFTVTRQTTETSLYMRYTIDTECGVKDTSENIVITVPAEPVAPCKNDTAYDPAHKDVMGIIVACDSFIWALNNDTIIYTDGIYYYNDGPLSEGSLCDQIYYVDVTINHSSAVTDTTATECESFYWRGETYTASGVYYDSLTNIAGCDSIIRLTLTINHPSAVTDTTATECESFDWRGNTYTASGVYYDSLTNIAGCDSIIRLTLTINHASAVTDTTAVECDEFTWYGQKYTASGDYDHLLKNAAGCDSMLTLHLTIHNSVKAPTEKETHCYYFDWHGVRYTQSGLYSDTLATIHNCDSVCTLDLTINMPYVDTLEVKAYYGYRVIMINRNQIKELGWKLDSLDLEHPEYVTWYQMLGATPDVNNDKEVWKGYYYTLPNGEPLPAGNKYYAVIDIPATSADACGAQGITRVITIGNSAAAPALVPSLSKPGQDIQVINLNPMEQTTIRIYSADGLLQRTYISYGEESFTIKAANDLGFYLVELSSEEMKTTLRYIVK